MFSLSKIATFALVALGSVASAVPAKRQSGSTAVEVLNSLTSAVTPIAAQFGEQYAPSHYALQLTTLFAHSYSYGRQRHRRKCAAHR